MSYLTDASHIECNTIQDVFNKYTSKAAQQKYSYRLCEVTMAALGGTNYDDYSCIEPTEADLAKVNREIKADIDSDLRRVIDLMYDSCTCYVADMVKKGVMQMLSAADLKRVKMLLDGFEETYDSHLGSAPKAFIQSISDDEETTGQINHYDLLFHISSDCVHSYLTPLRLLLEKLNHRIRTAITGSLMDVLIKEKSPTKASGKAKIHA